MARKPQTTAIINWDEELAKAADASAQMEANTGGGQFFSVRGGVLQFDGNPLPGNQACVIITDTILENVYYDGPFEPDSPTAPTCFAFGRDEAEMEPHESVDQHPEFERQHATCRGCPQNEFGTADVGRGKACRNTRRLALIPAGSYDAKGNLTEFDDEDHFKRTPLAFMKLPVTSVKGYASFVKQVAGTLRRPPHGIISRMYVVPDPKTQFKVVFEALDKVPNTLMATVMARHQEAKSVIDFPYTPMEEAEAPTKPARGRAAPAKGRAAAKPKARARKY